MCSFPGTILQERCCQAGKGTEEIYEDVDKTRGPSCRERLSRLGPGAQKDGGDLIRAGPTWLSFARHLHDLQKCGHRVVTHG